MPYFACVPCLQGCRDQVSFRIRLKRLRNFNMVAGLKFAAGKSFYPGFRSRDTERCSPFEIRMMAVVGFAGLDGGQAKPQTD